MTRNSDNPAYRESDWCPFCTPIMQAHCGCTVHIRTETGCVISCDGQGHLPCPLPEHRPESDIS